MNNPDEYHTELFYTELMMYFSQMMSDYSKEIGTDINLQQLIDSHRALRESAKVKHTEYRQFCEQGRELAKKQEMDYTWIKISDLREMTVLELMDLLS